MDFSSPQADYLLVSTAFLQSGKRGEAADWAANGVADRYPDRAISPNTLAWMLDESGVHTQVIVWPGNLLPAQVVAEVRTGHAVFALMAEDGNHPCEWWTMVHVCHDGDIRLACYLPKDEGRPSCYSLLKQRSGHYVITDLSPVPYWLKLVEPSNLN